MQAQKSFNIHYSILQENGTLARKVQVVPGKDKGDATDTLKKSLEVEKVDMRKIYIYKVELSASKLADEKAKPASKPEPESPKLPKTLKEIHETFPPPDGTEWTERAKTPNGFANRVMSFVCDVKQNVITNKDEVRTLKLVLEISGTQVNGVQGGMLKYRPQESLKITCEPIQIDALDDKTKKPEKQMNLDDSTRTKKQEEKKGYAEREAEKKKTNSNAKPEDKPAQSEKMKLPRPVISQGTDSKGNHYYFDRAERQMYKATKVGAISKVDGPPSPLTQHDEGYKGQ